ncbi:MAG: GAF domain-containing protein [Verrucomicrobia bacterium]|nr:GAF domain-containing protein [Verrucomicrobiota bacterium]
MLAPRTAPVASLPLRDARWLLLYVGYLLTAGVALAMLHPVSRTTMLWLAGGVAVAALVRWGLAGWPVIAAASVSINLIIGDPRLDWVAIAGFAVGSAGSALATAALLRRWNFDPSFQEARDGGLFLLAAMLGTAIWASVGAWGAPAGSGGFFVWYARDLLGVLVAAPPLLTFSERSVRDLGKRALEFSCWLAALLLASFLLLYGPRGPHVQSFALAFLPLALVVWAALRFGAFGAGCAVLMLALGSTAGAALGEGPLAGLPAESSRVLLWSYLGTACLLSLMIGALEADRRQSVQSLAESRAMLEALRRAQATFIGSRQHGAAFDDLLATVLEVTGSQYGFIAEVLRDGAGKPYLRTFAFTNITWDEASRELYTRHMAHGLEFRNHRTLFGAALTSQAYVIANDAPRDPRAGGLPPGHPPLHTFLGLPFFTGTTMTGMIGLANRVGGYQPAHCRALEPFLTTCATLVEAVREERQATEANALRSSRNRALDRLAAEAPLAELLELFVREIESLCPRWRGSILLLDGSENFLLHGSAPNLPAEWNEKVHGLQIGPTAGTCGAAAYLGQPMVAPDIQTHPSWAPYRELAAKHGFRACVSLPIVDPTGKVLGTFALYGQEPGEPGATKLAMVSEFARLASVAIQKHRVGLERARAVAELKRSEELLRRTSEVARMGGWELDLRTRELAFSPEVARMHGVAPGGRLRVRDVTRNYPEEARAKLLSAVRLARREGREWDLELAFYDMQARRRWVRMQGVPEMVDGKMVRLRGTLQDITERKAAEAERSELQAQLQQAQRMDALGTLAGGIAHDFNNILAAIVGNAELAALRLDPEHRALEAVQEITRAGLRARGLIQQILAFARPQQRPARLLDLGAVLNEALGMLRATLPAGIQVSAECDPQAPMVLGDPTQLQQVLMNLGTNAWHALEGRNGHIRLRLETIPAGRAAEESPPFVSEVPHPRITVEDNGSGMDAATMARIFEPFFTTKEVGRGTGLGLSVAHGIVKNLGGAIRVRSEPGVGSVFTIDLPAAARPGAARAVESLESLAAAKPVSGTRVMLVDDEATLVDLARRALEPCGCVVTSFTDPNSALRAILADPAGLDLLVVDYNMPDLSGLEVATQARASRADLPVVLASGYLTVELRELAEQAGVVSVLAKPYHIRDLLQAVATHARPGRLALAG